ncbi:MAG: chorismate mutase [Clostridia bacterium]|nr:chorismate mutase [Clostridia bacterium]
MESKLEQARKIISEADAEMAALFVRRMRAVELVCEHKTQYGLPVLDEAREAAVIAKNTDLIEDDVLKGYYIDYIKGVMEISRAYQHRLQSGLKVAYSGVEGAFAHIAAGKIFPTGNRIACRDFKAAYDSVVSGENDVAVLPIENSYAGEVGQTVDLIFHGSLFINGVYELEIRQNLLGVPGASVQDIQTVISHPQALGQCHDYIERRQFKTEEASNTALAARAVARARDRTVGAIASAETAALYGLTVLEENINKSSENTTRFAVLSRVRASSLAMSHSVLMFTVRHEAGSLAKAVSIIGKYGCNMTALRSRPLKEHSWQYYFYMEIDGAADSDRGRQMLAELNEVCDRLKVVGSYEPHARL